MAIAAGIRCDVDPLLANVMKTHCGKWEEMEGEGEGGRRKMLMYRTEHLYTRQLSHFTSTFTPSLSHTPDKSKEDYNVWSLYLVFLAVTLPDLAFKPDSTFLPSFEGRLFIPSTPSHFSLSLPSSSCSFSIPLFLPFSSLSLFPQAREEGVEDRRGKGTEREGLKKSHTVYLYTCSTVCVKIT